MSSEDNKKIKISVQVDDVSISAFRRAIREITADVANLVKQINEASRLLGGAFSTRASGAGGRSSAGASAPRTTPGGSNTLGKFMDNTSEPFYALGKSAKGAANEVKAASRVMSNDIVQFSQKTSDAVSETIEKMEELQELQQKIITKGGPNVFVKGANPFAAMTPGPASSGGGGLFSGQLGTALLGGGGGGFRSIASALGVPSWAVGGAGVLGAAYGAWNLSKNVYGAIQDREANLAQNYLEEGMHPYQMRARMAQATGNMARTIRGSLPHQIAVSKLTRSDMYAGMSDEARRAMFVKAMHDAGMTSKSGFEEYNQQRINSILYSIGKGGSFQDVDIQGERAARVASSIKAQQIERMGEVINQKVLGMDALDVDAQNNFYSNVQGRISGMNAAGTGWGYKRVKDPKTGKWVRETDPLTGRPIRTNLAERLGEGSIFSNAEVQGARQSIRNTLGPAFQGMAKPFLDAQYGGLGNVAGIYGAGAMFGGAAGGSALLGTVQHRGVGTGGINVAAGAQIADLVTQQMMVSGNMGTGTEAMAGFLAAGATGDPGFDLRAARNMREGLGAANAWSGGTLDPLQQGLNIANAASALSKAGMGGDLNAIRALAGMSAAEHAQIARSGGKIAPGSTLANLGVTDEIYADFTKGRENTMLTRYYSAGTGSAVDIAAQGARGAGGIGAYLKQQLGTQLEGVSDPEKRKKIRQQFLNQQIGVFGDVAVTSGLAKNRQEGEGVVRNLLSLDKELFPDLKSRGVAAAAHGSLEETTKKHKDLQKTDEEYRVSRNKENIAEAGGQNQVDSTNVLAKGGTVDIAVQNFVEALSVATQALKGAAINLGVKPMGTTTTVHTPRSVLKEPLKGTAPTSAKPPSEGAGLHIGPEGFTIK